jgi:hypothetical protein
MKTSLAAPLTALMALAAPFPVAAQHFSRAYIDIRLVKPDSVRVTVEAEGADFKNAVGTFPYYNEPPGSGMESFRLYERRIEAYLQQKVKLRADGKIVAMNVVSWKPGGKNREDRFDTLSIFAPNHAITLGGRLPPGAKSLRAMSELWVERVENPASAPSMQYLLMEGTLPLRQAWTRTERWVSFPLEPDSLARMRKSPLPPIPPRIPADHSQHNH